MAKTSKPRLIEWLETETGQSLDPPTPKAPLPGNDRHVSVRLPSELYARVETAGRVRGETVSQAMRRMVCESLDRIDHPDAAALDTAIAALQDLKRQSA